MDTTNKAGMLLSIPHMEPQLFIKSNSNEVYEFFLNHYSPYCIFTSLLDAIACCVELVIERKNNRQFQVSLGDVTSFVCQEEELLNNLSKIPHTILRPCNSYIVGHGGAVSYNNQGIVLLGKTMAGKTTLTTYLVSNGFKYFTDDIAIVNYECNILYSYQKPIHLREKSLQLLKHEYNLILNTTPFSLFGFERFIYNVDSTLVEPCYIHKFIVLNRKQRCVANIKKMDKKTAFMAILENSYTVSSLPTLMKAAHTISLKHEIYELTYSRLDEAAELIKNL